MVSDKFKNDDLHKQIENNMPIAVMAANDGCLSEVSKELSRRYFIIHEAYAKHHSLQYGYMPINDMFFMISFLTKNGLIDHTHQRMIISGTCVIGMISSSSQLTSVKRFVYDKAFAPVPKPIWQARQSNQQYLTQTDNMSQMSQESFIYQVPWSHESSMNVPYHQHQVALSSSFQQKYLFPYPNSQPMPLNYLRQQDNQQNQRTFPRTEENDNSNDYLPEEKVIGHIPGGHLL